MSTPGAAVPPSDVPSTTGEGMSSGGGTDEADAQDLSMAGPDGAGASSVDDPANGPVGDDGDGGEPVFRTPDPDDPTRPIL